MNEKTSKRLGLGLGIALIVGGPAYFGKKEVSALNAERQSTDSQTMTLESDIARGKKVLSDALSYADSLNRLEVAMPTEPDINGAIRALENLSANAQVTWKSGSSAAPNCKKDVEAPTTVPVSGDAKKDATATPATTAAPSGKQPTPIVKEYPTCKFDLAVVIEGSFENIMTYLELIRSLSGPDSAQRLFVVKNANVSLPKPVATQGTPLAATNGASADASRVSATLTLGLVSFGSPPVAAKAPVSASAGAGASPVTSAVALPTTVAK